MADKKIITDELLKLQTEKILQTVADSVYDLVPFEEQEIDDMFDATPQEISYYESLINPDVVSENRLWSSKTIDEKLASAILEANKYTDEAATRNLTTEIVTATSDVTKENVLYLILSDASTNTYEQYMLINGASTALGSTQVDLSNVYNKTEIDTKLDGKANKSEVLSIDSVQATTGSETNDTVYTSKLTKDELDKKANDGEVVKKIDVVDNLTSTDTNKPLSANQGMLLKSMVLISGVVLPYAGSSVPNGFLLCDGQAVSRTTYKNLFDVIGTTYGNGDGSTTFNLPNLQDKFIQGVGTNAVGTEMSAGLPNITGSFIPGSVPSGHSNYAKGAFQGIPSIGKTICDVVNPTNLDYGYGFNASRSNSIYGNSNTVQPPAIVMNYIIKY